MMADHIYCGSGKEKDFGNGTLLSVSINLTELLKNYAEHGYLSKDGQRKMMTLKVGRRREVGKYGETHTVEIDTWKPTKQPESSGVRPSQNQQAAQRDSMPLDFPSDIPY